MNVVQKLASFSQVNAYLRRFHDQSVTEYNLNNMLKLMDYLGNPQNGFKAVHVAGTSGKTSTAYFMAALLTAAGQKTGLTVSPHVDEMNERVQLNGQPLPEAQFCAAMTEFLEQIETAPVQPSWFEAMVAFAYWYFARQPVDYAVVEVGLGGLKDGTNVISRPDKVCIITDIGFDHMKTLGNTLREIAAQKAGIIQPGNPVFTYKQSDEIMAVLKNSPGELHVTGVTLNDTEMPDYQFRNWQLAYKTYEFLVKRDGLPHLTDQVLKDTQHVLVPGRMDVRQVGDKTVIMDGAHNVQKMEAFVSSFQRLYPGVKPAVMLAMRTGKEYEAVAPMLEGLANRVVVTTFETTQDLPIRSLPPEQIAAAFKGIPVQAIPDQKAAYQALISGPESHCVVTGSLYLLGQVRHNEQL